MLSEFASTCRRSTFSSSLLRLSAVFAREEQQMLAASPKSNASSSFFISLTSVRVCTGQRGFIQGHTAQSLLKGLGRNLLADFLLCRDIAQKSLDIRQYACGISIQSAEKSNSAFYAQALRGVAQRLTPAAPPESYSIPESPPASWKSGRRHSAESPDGKSAPPPSAFPPASAPEYLPSGASPA